MEGLVNYEKEERPWGSFERFTLNEKTTVKIIEVKSGEAFSLQMHDHRDEFWYVLAGSGLVTIERDAEQPAKAGDTFFVPRGVVHRVQGGVDGIRFLEISFGHFDESDIQRLADKYGRA